MSESGSKGDHAPQVTREYSVGRNDDDARSLEQFSVKELRDLALELDIKGRTHMTKDDLVTVIRWARSANVAKRA